MFHRKQAGLPIKVLGMLALVLLAGGCRSAIKHEADPETGGRLRESVENLKGTSPESPQYIENQVEIARLKLLLGAAHSGSKLEQRKLYAEAGIAAERALQSDKTLRQAMMNGMAVPEAAQLAGEQYFEPLFLWSTAVFYHFRDVASLPEKILFRKRLEQARDVLLAISEKDPQWGDGIVPFSLGIYYLSVPEVFGGDRKLAEELMEKAVQSSDRRLLPRWGRAKYLAVATGDREGFLRDLKWVLAQDLNKLEGPEEWNRYFQRDAQSLLEAEELLF